MCVLSIKVPIRKKSGNLFNDPRISAMSLKENSKGSQYAIINLFRQVADSTRLIGCLLTECKEIQKHCYLPKN